MQQDGRGAKMNEFIASVLGGPLYLKVTSAILLALVIIFFVFFLGRGLWHWFKLGKILAGIKRLSPESRPDVYRILFASDKRLVHLWDEYEDTLHEQKEERGGVSRTIAWRATLPSETYFNSQYVVDSRLATEFFKHLPGIFTGIGIIGTFLGLINGLHDFHVSADPARTIEGIRPLMEAVREAFLVSASAISAAMIVTFVEKVLVAALYTRTEEICHAIDARFEAGAGEEYLSRLVSASEDSASQSKILKDALVTELGDILREISSAQTAAMRASNQDLGSMFSASIENSLKQPLSRIENAFKDAQGGQSERTVQMLSDVMASFSQRLNDLFGGQITGINELSRQSAETMKEAVTSLHALVGELGDKGKQTTDRMAEKMAESIAEMEQRQTDINARTEAVLQRVSEQMSGFMASFAETHSSTLAANREREAEMASRASGLVEGFKGSVEAVIQEMSAASQTMARSVDRLSNATTSSIEKMNVGADKIASASASFVVSGTKVSEVMDKAALVGNRLTEISGQMAAGSNALQESFRDYQSQRQAVVALLENAKATIEHARKEAGITEDVLQRIEASTSKLAQVQFDFETYLDGVSDTLAASSSAFQDVVKSTLQQVNTDFHGHLSQSVRLLKGAVQELEVTLASLGSRR
jgi:ABC-type transporter Mla subunit MlaD